jgi:RES domain-containing protein
MTHRTLRKAKTAYRIGDPDGRFPIWDEGGARLFSGRWHQAGDPVIYASEFYSTAMLEKLVHHSGDIPDNQHFIEITIPAGVTYEVVALHKVQSWRTPGSMEALDYGHNWCQSRRSAVLFVPSVVAPMEMNLIFNTLHPDFARIETGLETPVYWDSRLFGA